MHTGHLARQEVLRRWAAGRSAYDGDGKVAVVRLERVERSRRYGGDCEKAEGQELHGDGGEREAARGDREGGVGC